MVIAATSKPSIPLENGDRLSRFEFERRYRAMPELKKAELVEGVVYIASTCTIKNAPIAGIRYRNTWYGEP